MKILIGLISEPKAGRKKFISLFKKHMEYSHSIKDYSEETTPCFSLVPGIKRDRTHDIAITVITSGFDIEKARSEMRSIIVFITANQKTRFKRFKKDFLESPDWFWHQERMNTTKRMQKIGETHNDVAIQNNGSLKELENQVKTLCKEVKKLLREAGE